MIGMTSLISKSISQSPLQPKPPIIPSPSPSLKLSDYYPYPTIGGPFTPVPPSPIQYKPPIIPSPSPIQYKPPIIPSPKPTITGYKI